MSTTSPTSGRRTFGGASASVATGARSKTATRTINRSRNGASAKNTSGPNRPPATALRATGFTAYAIAVTSAGPSVARCDRARRNAPAAPSGSAPTITTVRARPIEPRRTVLSALMSSSTGGAAVAEPRPV